MTSLAYALARAELIRALTAYTGIATADGTEEGTTIIDANLDDRNDFITEKTILIMSGPAAYEDKGAQSFVNTHPATITLQGTGFSAQIKAGTIYRILNISSIEIDVANIDTKIGSYTDAAGTTTLFAWLAKLFAQGGQGLVYYGKVTMATMLPIPHFEVSGLTGFGDNYFKDFRVYVVRDAAGAGAAPQGEMQPVTSYGSSAGSFTHPQFTIPLAVDDEVLILHQRIAEIKDLIDRLGAFTGTDNLKAILGAYTAAAPLKAAIDAIKGAIGIFHEQADTVVNITAIAASETDVLNLAAAGTRYIVRSLRLKCADPGANTVTIRLYGLVNDVLTEVDSFVIDTGNFGTYQSLMDMFGLPHLAGDNLKVTVQASAGGPYAVTGQYSHAKTNV